MDLFWNRGCSRNIIFEEPYNEERFAVVIACRLDETIGALPNGNMAFIGKGYGIKLALSQRERLNLARLLLSVNHPIA